MLRPALAIVLASMLGCGGPAAPPATPGPTPLPLPPASPANTGCAAVLEDAPPGSHDRYAFEDADGRYGYRDGRGAIVIPARFGFAYQFGRGGIAAAVEAPTTADGVARFVFIATDGAVLAQAYAFDNGPDYFQEGLARIVDGGRVGFLDRGGAVVIAPQFVGATGFCHGVATVNDGREQWDIDRSGQVVSARQPYVPEDDPCGD